MKDLIIISNYDGGINYSITIDGVTASRECLEEMIVPLSGKLKEKYKDHKKISDMIRKECNFYIYDVLGEINTKLLHEIALMFYRSVIVCEDGNTYIIRIEK